MGNDIGPEAKPDRGSGGQTQPEGEASSELSAKDALAKLVSAQPNRAVKKLSFFEQCAVFAAAYNHVSHRTVAEAFGVSMTTVSLIGGCLERDPRPCETKLVAETEVVKVRLEEHGRFHKELRPTGAIVERLVNRDMNKHRSSERIQRYWRVAEEFHRLGEDAFTEKYCPDFIRTRLAKVEWRIRAHGPDTHKWAGIHDLGEEGKWSVESRDDKWVCVRCEPRENQHNTFGAEMREQGFGAPIVPFASAGKAVDSLYEDLAGLPSPRPKRGRK